ncbi:MAG: thioredoxin [Candidatus Omnitrophica bacterium]|nr:thioredoxin [Candidatus Omnitrophota bacterium]
MAGNLIEITTDNFKKEVLNSEIPVLVDFWTEWCMPCRMVSPIVDELSEDYKGKVKFTKVNVDNNTQLATDLEILSIPVLILFKNGKELTRIVGANPKSYIQEQIEAALGK